MARRDTYVTTAALLAVLAGASWVSYAVAQGEAAYGIEVSSVETPPTGTSPTKTPKTETPLSGVTKPVMRTVRPLRDLSRS